MCGIFGLYNFQANTSQIVQNLKKRGPDSNEIKSFLNEKLILGHTRLAIIDKSSNANQPMSDENGSIHLVYNGEIYNFLSIKEKLEEYGYKFRSDSDTETIIHAYKHWGISAFEKFEGMFAFVIYDERTNDLILCRDKFGIKPLVYYKPFFLLRNFTNTF